MSENSTVDAVVIGAGHNALVAAAYLARAGWSVAVLERTDRPGGAVRTDELTRPGYRHDTLSGFHLLLHGSAVMAELGAELAARGLSYANTDGLTCATATTEGAVVLLHRDVATTTASFSAADAVEYQRLIDYWVELSPEVGHLMGAPLESVSAVRSLAGIVRALGVDPTLAFGRDMAISADAWLREHFADPRVRDLLAPWVMHAGLGPGDGGGGFPLLTLAAVLHTVGMPVAVGGSDALVQALVRLIEDHGGSVVTHSDVETILTEVHRGTPRAIGVRTAAGETITARRAVIACTTPTQLYQRLLAGEDAPPTARREAAAYRFGTADMQMHLALSAPLRWRDSRLDTCPTINVTPGLDQLGVACAQARAAMLPTAPTFLLGQPLVLDPSRAPEGAGLIWIQLLQQPNHPTADAAGEIDLGAGGWTPQVRDRYAERVLTMIRALTTNLDDVLLSTVSMSPADLAQLNINFVDGDPYAGACTLDQSYLWRPLPSHGGHETPIGHLWMCGASTYPGPGVNGASGRIVAHVLSARSRRADARRIVNEDPLLARELRIGRPDLPRDYDDGGLVDLNSAPSASIADVCGLDAAMTNRIVQARAAAGVPFAQVDDVFAYTDIPVDLWERIRDRAVTVRV